MDSHAGRQSRAENAIRLYAAEGKEVFVSRAKLPGGDSIRYSGELVVERATEGHTRTYVLINSNEQDIRVGHDFEVLTAPPGSYYWSPYEDLTDLDQACECWEDGNGDESPKEPVSWHRSKSFHAIFGWTEWTEKLNLNYLVSAGRTPEHGDIVLVARVTSDDGNYLYGCLVRDHQLNEFMEVFGTELAMEQLRPEVLLATPGYYFWTTPTAETYPHDTVPSVNSEHRKFVGKRDHRCIARAVHRGELYVGEMHDGLFYIRAFGPGYFSRKYEVLVVKRPRATLRCKYLGWAPYHFGMSPELVVKVNHSNSATDTCFAISRMLLPQKQGHLFEQCESLHNVMVNGAEVLVCSRPRNTSWVFDHSGYVPIEALRAGNTRDQECVYIGRFEKNSQMKLGLIVPSWKNCTSISSSEEQLGSYEVLVHSKDDPDGQELEGEKIAKSTQLLREMKSLQNKHFHGLYSKSTDFHIELTQLLLRCKRNLFEETKEWIPYMSRLARVQGLPQSFRQVLFKFLEAPSRSGRNSKYRVACIIRYCIQKGVMRHAGSRSVSNFCSLHDFMPLLKFFSTLTASKQKDASAQMEVLLDAIVDLIKGSKSLSDLSEFECSEKFRDLLISCTRFVSPKVKDNIFSSLQVQEHTQSETLSDLDLKKRKIESLKRKSLAVSPDGVPMVLFPHTVLTTEMNFTVRQHNLTEKEEMHKVDCAALYHETYDVDERVPSREIPFLMDELPQLFTKEGTATFDEVSSLRIFLQDEQSSPLKSDKLNSITNLLSPNSRLSSHTRHEYTWAVVASLEKYKNDPYRDWPAIPHSTVDTIIDIAEHYSVTNDNSLVLGILTCLSHATGSFALQRKHVDQLVKLYYSLNEQSAKYEIIVNSLLRLLHHNITSENLHPSWLQLMTECLKMGSKQNRIQSAAWFYHWAVEQKMPLDKDVLVALANFLQDDVRDVKLYSRAAFSNGLGNNLKLRADDGLLEVLQSVYVTNITEIKEVGGIPRDLTGKINGPIYKMLHSILSKLPRLLDLYHKFAINYANFCTSSSNHSAFMDCMRAIGKNCTPGTLAAVEKVMKITEEEKDVATCVKFISDAIKNGLAKKFIVSATTLKKILKQMLRPGSHASIYPIALHRISGIQELPDDVFGYYHMELVSLRLKHGGLRKETMAFLNDSNLHNSHEEALLHWIFQHFRLGRQISRRSMDAVLNCMDSVESRSTAELILDWLVAAGLILNEVDLLRLMANKHPSTFMDSRLVLSILKNQDIPREVTSNIFEWVEALPIRKDHANVLDFVNLLLKNHSNPCEITQRSVKLATSFLHEAIKLKDYTGMLFIYQCRKILHTALLTDELGVLDLEQLKNVIMLEKEFVWKNQRTGLWESFDLEGCLEFSDLDLILELLDSPHAQTVQITWAEVNKLVVRAGEAIWNKDAKVQQRMLRLYRCAEGGCPLCAREDISDSCGKILVIDERPHVYFDILALKLCKLESPLIMSACNYLRNGGGLFNLPLSYTLNLQSVMQQSGKVADEIRSNLNHQYSTKHLQSIGDCTFQAWCNSKSEDVYRSCTALMEDLFKYSWRPSKEANQSLKILRQQNFPWIATKLNLPWPLDLTANHTSDENIIDSWTCTLQKMMLFIPTASVFNWEVTMDLEENLESALSKTPIHFLHSCPTALIQELSNVFSSLQPIRKLLCSIFLLQTILCNAVEDIPLALQTLYDFFQSEDNPEWLKHAILERFFENIDDATGLTGHEQWKTILSDKAVRKKYEYMKTLAPVRFKRIVFAQTSSFLSRTLSIVDLRAQAAVLFLTATIYQALFKHNKEHLFYHVVAELEHLVTNSDEICSDLGEICSYIEKCGSSFQHTTLSGLQAKATTFSLAQNLHSKLEGQCVFFGALFRAGRLQQVFESYGIQRRILAQMNSCKTEGLDQLVRLLGEVDAGILEELPIVQSEDEIIAEVTARYVESKFPPERLNIEDEIITLTRTMMAKGALKWEDVFAIKDWSVRSFEKLAAALKISNNYNVETINVASYKSEPTFQSVVPAHMKCKGIKSTRQIINEFEMQGQSRGNQDELVKFIVGVRGIYRESTILKNQGAQDISTWNEATIKSWATAAAVKKSKTAQGTLMGALRSCELKTQLALNSLSEFLSYEFELYRRHLQLTNLSLSGEKIDANS